MLPPFQIVGCLTFLSQVWPLVLLKFKKFKNDWNLITFALKKSDQNIEESDRNIETLHQVKFCNI